MKGYKVFNHDWRCRGFKYEVGEVYFLDGELECRERGFHFCKNLADCFNYYDFDPHNKVAIVEAYGEVKNDGDRYCTNVIKIVKELSWEETLHIVNCGVNNTGYQNTGDQNSGNENSGNQNSGNWNSGDKNSGGRNIGDWNSGDWNIGNQNSGNWNSGDQNSGDWNTGHWNSGDWNTGNENSGNWNSGNYNSGNHNSGNWNSGDWNSGNHNNGVFNTGSPKINMFDEPSNWSYEDWFHSEAREIMCSAPYDYDMWLTPDKMTKEEKLAHPDYKITHGCMRHVNGSIYRQAWWNGLPDSKKRIITSLPNFNAEKFKKCTGISVNKED